jgi:predicted RNA-binding protein (virulence factor B family)
MIIGSINKLLVDRKTDLGYVLKEEDVEIFLHNNDCNQMEPEAGSIVNAFLFFDHKGRLTATLEHPLITTVDCDFVEIVDVMPFGVFVNIGIRKDILFSSDDLPLNRALWPQVGDQVYAYLQNKRNKALLVELASREDYEDIKVAAEPSIFGFKLQVRVLRIATEGVNVMSEEGYLGFIHYSEYKDEPRLGQLLEARVIKVKEDGEINLSLLLQKELAMTDDAQTILDYLLENDGVMLLYDKSSPEAIDDLLNMSKAAFKRALGRLLKENKVKQDVLHNCVTLIEEDE